ncbi:unnamed protein product [Clonostachys byssicola]|uniref:Carboxylesterase type B domain-containing protein n=1 Tax=Clonostachys byssicola TaxID=160290 RepID=A0A9N9YBH4_9HYPO|nr:unnamed protein product [Clonostachys byssicola]
MSFNTVIIEHGLLGKVTGIQAGSHVTQFLGIKYASVKGRFEESLLFEQTQGDASRFGPACPQDANGLQIEQEYLIQKALPLSGDKPVESETECLNLNITVPRDIPTGKKLPVLVWIHGGGFLFGANFWPQTDMRRLVTLGIESEMPFIGVSLNYRTNCFGFLASSELREAGYHGNYGLKDQINGFVWIKKFIAGFGGDPENVTAMGESCGGVSATLLLQSNEPLFRRLISMGGHALLMTPIPLETANEAYVKVVDCLGLKDLPPEQRVKKLRTIPHKEIIDKVPISIPNRPVIDGTLFQRALTSREVENLTDTDSIPGKAWCQDLLIGDCQADGYIMSGALDSHKKGIGSRLATSLTRSLSKTPQLVTSILSDYQINEAVSDDAAFHRIVALLTDVGFYAPLEIAVRGWPNTHGRYLYHFNAPNPFSGPLQGKASHVLDVAYAFQNYNDYLSPSDVGVARDFALAIVRFVYKGQPGWPAWSDDALGDPGVFGYTTDPDTTFGTTGRSQRRPFIPRLLEEYSHDLLWGALQKFLNNE